MKQFTAFNLPPPPVVIGEFAWAHIQAARTKSLIDANCQFYSIKVVGDCFDIVHAATGLPVRNVPVLNAPGYRPMPIPVGDYPETYQQVKLVPLPIGSVPAPSPGACPVLPSSS